MSISVEERTEMTLEDAARESNISTQTLRKFIRAEKLVATKRPNKRYAIARENLQAFLQWYRGDAEGAQA